MKYSEVIDLMIENPDENFFRKKSCCALLKSVMLFLGILEQTFIYQYNFFVSFFISE